MRRKQNEITDPEIIDLILSESEVCRIAIIDKGRPYIVPLNYGYKDNAIFFHSATAGRKIDILRADNKVCFEIEFDSQVLIREKACDCSTKYRSVIGYGTIEFIEDPELKKEGLDIIMSHYGKEGENIYPEQNLENVMILKLKIEEITGKQSGDWE